MKMVVISTLGLGLALSAIDAGLALAQSGGGGQMMERFETLDSDSDGQISAAEATDWHETIFLTMDADEDAQLTREEYMAIQLGNGADPEQRGPRYAERQAEKEARFTQMDADGDGFVTQDQFMTDGQNDFAATDTDQDGLVSMPEFMAARRL